MVGLLVGCEQQPDPVELYKEAYKQGLANACRQHGVCLSDVEKAFDQCIDEMAVKDMLASSTEEEKTHKNTLIAQQTSECIKNFSDKQQNN
ncbi:hypothetical protein [Pleionea sp. CnH1-48]|uniref:hypothetical protein n=1 Tax=Pleionea sp. CnH1-48 TaxID=2954494 RepID=UPI0020985A50|nr:hypothetical protein [Pleionea sp. CnH1-48]MCO7224601.1 hypothetical protein [Pleionea sp. CnH1-48]